MTTLKPPPTVTFTSACDSCGNPDAVWIGTQLPEGGFAGGGGTIYEVDCPCLTTPAPRPKPRPTLRLARWRA